MQASALKPGVDYDRAVELLDKLIQRLDSRRKHLDDAWTRWLDNKAQLIRNRANWERVMAQCNKVVYFVTFMYFIIVCFIVLIIAVK